MSLVTFTLRSYFRTTIQIHGFDSVVMRNKKGEPEPILTSEAHASAKHTVKLAGSKSYQRLLDANSITRLGRFGNQLPGITAGFASCAYFLSNPARHPPYISVAVLLTSVAFGYLGSFNYSRAVIHFGEALAEIGNSLEARLAIDAKAGLFYSK